MKLKKKSFKNSMKNVIVDIVNGEVSSRNLNKAADIKKYVARWPHPKPKAGGKPLTATSFKPILPPKKSKAVKGLAPKDMICTIGYPALVRVLNELQRIDYVSLPNAAHDLLRTVLECSLKAYFEYKSVTVIKRGKYTFLNDVLQTAENHFQTVKPALVQPIRIISGNRNYLQSQDCLNALNHNPSVFSTGTMVKEAWDQMEPIIRYALDPK